MEDFYHIIGMTSEVTRQQDRAIALLTRRGMARLTELVDAGVTATTLSRMERAGKVVRLARGLYQLPDAPIDAHHSLAEAAMLVPKGIICLQSALAYHDLTDRIPRSIWMAIGFEDWRPRIAQPPIHIVRFGPKVLRSGIEHHTIEGVPVRIFGAAKTVVDLFRCARAGQHRYNDLVGRNQAIEGLREALRQHKATPAEIAKLASEAGGKVWEYVEPHLSTLTADA